MKKILTFGALAIVGMAWMGCGLTEPVSNNVSIMESEVQEVLEPVPGVPMFDGLYEYSKHKVDFSNVTEDYMAEFDYDLSRIESEATRLLIVELCNKYGYSEFCLIENFYDNMDGVEVTKCLISLNEDFWLIVSDGYRAYAIKDDWGINSGEFEYLIEDTELYR